MGKSPVRGGGACRQGGGRGRRGVLAAAACLALAAGCGRSPQPGAAPGAGEKGPELLAVTGEQLQQRVRSSPAEVVLVNVWATWCLPCREEFPALVRLAREFPRERLDLVLVSADFPDQAEVARQFLAEQGVTFASYLKEGKDQQFIDAVSERWSGALPATFVYDRSRRLVRFWEGGASFEEFRAAVDMAAAGEAAGKG